MPVQRPPRTAIDPWVILALLWTLAPLLWQLQTSLLPPEALVASQGLNPPVGLTLANYRQVLNADPPFWLALRNSAVVAGGTTLLTLGLALPCAYGLHRQAGVARSLLNLSLLAATLFPTVLLFLALLEIARAWHLANNLLALCLPYAGLSLPLAILLLRAAFDALPAELDDAARLDGLKFPQRLRLILMPLLAPTIGSTAILVFLFSWNEYPIALTWLSRTELLTLPVAIARLAGSSVFIIPYGAFAAATVLGSLPLLLLVLLFQKAIVSGLTQGAVKG
ncbi:MAG: carbohydrate ABC transporter permease [Synechococcaceae cyanobacterium]|nr:carbohydrate ABC transporter permease [Synechococcaceae cyanobacterium]